MLPSQRWNPSSQKEFRTSLGQASYLTSPTRSCNTMSVQKVFYPDMPTATTGFFGPVIRFEASCCNISLSTSSCLNPLDVTIISSSTFPSLTNKNMRYSKISFFEGVAHPKMKMVKAYLKSFIDWTLDKVGQKTSAITEGFSPAITLLFSQKWHSVQHKLSKQR